MEFIAPAGATCVFFSRSPLHLVASGAYILERPPACIVSLSKVNHSAEPVNQLL